MREYFRDYHFADLKASVMNASGNYKKVFTASDLLTEIETAAPVKSEVALRDALKMVGAKHHGQK